ncbi:hypothetical protein [Halapricum desulfuricans]|uniref:Putative metalloprotease, contains C-terminal PDZ domain n=1 Tax=Halapricum desulfuricans TaxID=2841257 RepID=A0A897N948_9EURY|nr:hypothetical protein [Halapricum desulfuricans]QSG09014.1 putative metalloprotease, contains C-terminal PDZ domain [Halapricum desulfuricans]
MPSRFQELPGSAASVVLVVLFAGAVVTVVVLDPGATAGADDGPSVESVSGTGTVTVTYTDTSGASDQFTVAGVDPALASPEHGWAIVDRSSLPSVLRAVDDDPGNGVVGFGEWALVGAVETATVPIDGTELSVVVPAGRDVDPARKAGFIEAFAGPYPLSPNADRSVVLLSVPDALPHEGLMYSDDRGYVTVEAFWDGDAHSVWLHEYVHARQDFRTADGMVWFREASARYLSARFMQEQYEGVTAADLRAELAASPGDERVVLANRTTWAGTTDHYHAGAQLLAAVDAEIRAETGGEHALVDVFRAINAEDEPVTVERFVGLVERRTGSDERWIAAAIAGDWAAVPANSRSG